MKTRKLGKILVVALFVLLFAALLAVSVSAAEPVTVDVTNEAELKAAVAAGSTADVVNLVDTIQITNTITVEKNVTITTATNATVVGKIAATTLEKGTAFKMFELAEGVNVTFDGNVVYSDAGIFLKGNNTLTLTGSVRLLPGIDCHALVDNSSTSTTINVEGNALIQGKWAVYYHADVTEDGVVKSFNMGGGEMATLYGVVSYGSGYDITATVEGALINVDNNLFHLDHATATASSVSFTDSTVTAGGNIVQPSASYNGELDVSVDGGTYTADYLIAAHVGVTIDFTLADGNFITKELWNEGGTLNTTKTGGVLTSNEFVLITAGNKATFHDTLADALSNAVDNDVIEVWGTHTTGDVNVNATVTFKKTGTVNGPANLTVAAGKNVTFADQGVWNNCTVVMSGNNTVTFTDDVVFASNDEKIIIDDSLTDTTVNVSGNATLTTNNWVADYTNSDTSTLHTKTFNMTGGSFSGSFGLVFTAGNVKIIANIENAEITATTNLFHLDTGVAPSEANRSEIELTNVTATADRYAVGLYDKAMAVVTISGAQGEYNVTGANPKDGVAGGALLFCSNASANLRATLADGAFNFGNDAGVILANNSVADVVVTMLPTVLDTLNAVDVMPNGAHVKKADGTVIACSRLGLAMDHDADGDVIEINGTIGIGAHITVDKNITINGTGTVNGGEKCLIVTAAEVTLDGSVSWTEMQIRPGAGATSIVNIKGDVSIVNTIESVLPYAAVIYYNDASATLTVNLSGNAYISGTRTVFVPTEAGDGDGGLTVTMDGGKIGGVFAFVVDTTSAALDFNLANGTIEVQKNVLHYNNGNADNVMTATLTNMTVSGGLEANYENSTVITYSSSNVVITVNGGTYSSTGLSFNAAAGTSRMVVDLQAGSFTGAPVLDFTNNGKLVATVNNACVLPSDGIIIPNGARVVLENGYTYYQTLTAAVAAAKADDVIELFGTNTVDAALVIKNNLTITGGEGTTVTASGTLFNVKSGAKLTLKGSTAWTANNKTGITVGEGGAHIVFTDAVQFTASAQYTNGSIITDTYAADNTTIEILATTSGEPKLTCGNDKSGEGIKFSATDSIGSGIKTVTMDGGTFIGAFFIDVAASGVTINVTAKNATFDIRHEAFRFDNLYVESDDGVADNGNVSTIDLENLTFNCKYIFNTSSAIRSNITITGGTYTCTEHAFQLDAASCVVSVNISNATIESLANNKAIFNLTAENGEFDIDVTGSTLTAGNVAFNATATNGTFDITVSNSTVTAVKTVIAATAADATFTINVTGGSMTSTGDRILNGDNAASEMDVTLNGGTYSTPATFAFFFKSYNIESLITITNGASISGKWGMVFEGLARVDLAADVTINAPSGKFAYARTACKTDSTMVYGSLVNLVAYAPADAVIEIAGNPSIPTLTIDKNLTITGTGNLTATTGASLFVVQNGAKLTIGGSATYNYNAKGIVIGEGGGHVVITDTVRFTTTSGSQNGAAVYDELGNVNTTVEILKSNKGAPTLESKGWTIDFEGADDTPYATTKKVYITGGTFTGSHNIVYNVGGVTADVYVNGATFTATSQVVYINNCYFATAGVDGKGNVGRFELVKVTVLSAGSVVDLASTDCRATVIVTDGNFYTTGNTFQYDRPNCVMNTTVTGGIYVTKDKFYNGCSNSVTHMTNVNVTAGFDRATNSYLTSGGYAITFGSSGIDDFTIDGEDTVVRAPLRVFAIHDYSNVTLNIDGGLYQNTTTDATTANCFVIYQSSNAGTASTLNLTAKNAHFINNAGNGSSALRINNEGSTNISSFTNCVLRGVHTILQNHGVMDLTLENTELQITGGGANRTDTGHGILIGASSGKNKIHLKSGTTIKAFEDTAELVLNPNKVGHGIAFRWISVDFTMEKGALIEVKGVGLGSVSYKNDKNETKNPRVSDSTFTINGGTITSEGTAIAFWANSSTDATNPSNLTINGGSFTSNGHVLWVYTDNGGCTATVNDGTFISQGTGYYACNTYSNDGNITLNIHGGLFETQGTGLGDYACQVKANGDNVAVVCNIYGGTFVANAGDAALYVLTKYSTPTEGCTATANVYGGYFEGHNLCAARSSFGGTLNVWGGTFRFANQNAADDGSPIRSGTGSNVGTVHIWGGNFYTTATAGSCLFNCMNSVSNLTIHGGFNGIGGRVVFSDSNNAVNGGSVAHKIGTQVVDNSIYMQEGAAVRLASGSNGLRFKGYVTAVAMAYINSIADAGSVTFGTIIAPEDYLTNAYAFTAEELDRLGLKYLDLKADYGLTANDDGSYTISAAIINIKEENYNRNFAATCYVEYTVDGNTVRVYSNFRELKNVRSMAQIARIALTDTGRYTEAQREILAIYAPTEAAPVLDIYLIAGQSNAAGCSSFTADFANSDPNFTNGYSNVLYHGVSAGGTDFATKRIYTNVPVKAGYGCGTGDIGPELGMAKVLSQVYNQETGKMAAIVKYGYGGTGLADTISGQNFPEGSWCPPSWLAEHGKVDEYKSGGLYRAFVMQIQSAISDYRALGYEINIVGGYWMQGENDRTKDVNTYAAMFECWVNDLRNDVYAITRDEADLKMPIMVGEISDYFNYNNYESNKAFTQMQREQIGAIENVHVMPSGTIPTVDYNDDKAHWDTHSALWLGQRVGITFMSQYLNTEYVVSDEDLVAEITLGGEVIGRYDSLVGAINEAPAGATVELKKDLTLYSTLAIGNRNQITLNGNGYDIDFKLPSYVNSSNASNLHDSEHTAMIMWYATDITINDLHIDHVADDHAWGTQLRQDAKVTWNRGSITSKDFCFVSNTNGSLTINGGEFTLTNGDRNYAGVIYLGNNTNTLNISGGTFTAAGQAKAIHCVNKAMVNISGGTFTAGETAQYCIAMLGTDGYFAFDKENATATGGTIAVFYNAGQGDVEDDNHEDNFD